MDNKFLNRVVDQLVNETRIDYEGEELYVPFTTQSFHAYFPSLFRSYGSFNSHCQDVYGLSSLEIKYVWDKWEVIILDKIRSRGRLGLNINESTGINKKFLDKVVYQIVGETTIDHNREVLNIPSLYHIIPTFSIYQFPTPPLIPPTEALNTSFLFYNFMKHCRDVYGLNYGEIIYVWKKYRKIIIDKIETKDNLNEARISSKINSDFLDEVVQYLIDNTVIIPDKTISVSHKKSKRGKIIIPVKDNIELEYYYNHLVNPSIVLLFSDEMENVYGLDPGLEIKYVWDKYKKHIFSNI